MFFQRPYAPFEGKSFENLNVSVKKPIVEFRKATKEDREAFLDSWKTLPLHKKGSRKYICKFYDNWLDTFGGKKILMSRNTLKKWIQARKLKKPKISNNTLTKNYSGIIII